MYDSFLFIFLALLIDVLEPGTGPCQANLNHLLDDMAALISAGYLFLLFYHRPRSNNKFCLNERANEKLDTDILLFSFFNSPKESIA